jgi:D-cysteine desulfhydrase
MGDASMEPALLRAYPALAAALPRLSFVAAPTPVTPLALEGISRDDLFVKHDEHSCPLYGGNKPRKLEFLIGDAVARRSRRLVTSGGLGTHHGLATAILGHSAGMATTLLLVDQPVTKEVRRSLLLCASWGAELVHSRNVTRAAAGHLGILAASAMRGERPYLIWPGGNSARGNLGFVSAGLELGEQVRAGLLPEPRELWVAVGTGGTLVGLAVGLALAGLATRLRGVRVSDILPPSPRQLAAGARRLLSWLRRLDPAIPEPLLPAESFSLHLGQLGDGYGAASASGAAALRAAAEQGLRLDPTYTAKCLAALLEEESKGALARGPVLFWNTFSDVDVSRATPFQATPADLPPSLQRLFENTAA